MVSLEPLERSIEAWRRAGNLAELWWSRHAGLPWQGLAAHRLALLVDHARRHSPFYRRHYARLGPGPDLHELPPVTREALMGRFDEWCTDRQVTRSRLEAFLADPARVGEPFLGHYIVWKSSGTTGTPGIYVQDAAALAVYDALVAAQLDEERFAAAWARLGSGASRAALVVATGDHFAGIASWTRLTAGLPGMQARSFSVLTPLPQLAAALDAFEPDFLASYPSVLSMLAHERRAGRLRAGPGLVWSGGETLTRAARARIEAAFGAPVMNEYGASECLSIGAECREGWMHVNAEWVVLEGVDASGRPVPPGVRSHTVLLTNLANWVQPVIRYDLGDQMVSRGSPCPCGDPRPAVRIEGRRGAPLELRDAAGHRVELAPLAIETRMEALVGARRFQVAQTGASRLALRFDPVEAPPARLRREAQQALRDFLADNALPGVHVALQSRGPRADPRTGKMPTVSVECRHKAPGARRKKAPSP